MQIKLHRMARLISSLAQAAYWDRLWQQLQRHQVFMQLATSV